MNETERVRVQYCSPSAMSPDVWGSGLSIVNVDELAQWLIERQPILVTKVEPAR